MCACKPHLDVKAFHTPVSLWASLTVNPASHTSANWGHDVNAALVGLGGPNDEQRGWEQVQITLISQQPNFLVLVSARSHSSSASWVVWSSEVMLRASEVGMSLTHRFWESQTSLEWVRGLEELQLYLLSAPEQWITLMRAIGCGGPSEKFDAGIKELKSFVLYRIKLRMDGG